MIEIVKEKRLYTDGVVTALRFGAKGDNNMKELLNDAAYVIEKLVEMVESGGLDKNKEYIALNNDEYENIMAMIKTYDEDLNNQKKIQGQCQYRTSFENMKNVIYQLKFLLNKSKLVDEKEKTMCDDCGNKNCHCDCAREFVQKEKNKNTLCLTEEAIKYLDDTIKILEDSVKEKGDKVFGSYENDFIKEVLNELKFLRNKVVKVEIDDWGYDSDCLKTLFELFYFGKIR